jgi:hypothetical protein
LFITNSFRLAIVGQAICPESVFISAVQICGATSNKDITDWHCPKSFDSFHVAA